MSVTKYSQVFGKTIKNAPAGAESINHQLLVRAGFIDQLQSGSWTLMPLGWRVISKINQIIRQEINTTGAQEMLMPLMHPRDIWDETGRWESAKKVMYQFKDTRGKEYALSFTHEEIVMDLIRKFVKSYKDLPVKIYHFSTKFRNEPRAKSGILRGREFMMKDLYSAHTTETELMEYYQLVKAAYLKIFSRIGLEIKVTEASGGVFTEKHSHEFQVIAPSGEDVIYFCNQCGWGQNKEVFTSQEGAICPDCHQGKIESANSIEVGNIFPLGQLYAQKMHANFTDTQGKSQTPWFGSYGIGPTRVMGTVVEVSHDDKGIIWPESVSPYQIHLITLDNNFAKGKKIANQLNAAGIEVLWDDRDISAGTKFVDADLIGIPYRVVVSNHTGDKIEVKQRNNKKIELITVQQLINQLKVQS